MAIQPVTGLPKPLFTDDRSRLQATLLDAVRTAIIATNLAGTITYWNSFAEELYGWSAEEVIGRDIMDVTVNAQTEQEARDTMSSLLAGKSWEGEFAAQRKGGSTFTASVRLSPIFDDDGKLNGIVGVSHDLTERKQAEEALRRSEEIFRTLANSLPDLCWMAHANGDIFWYNQRWYEFTGTNPQEMTGWGWQAVHDPEMLPAVLERWKKSIESGQDFEMEFPLRAANGVFRWFLTRVRPLRGGDGKVAQWFGANIDIQEQREIRESLKHAHQELETRVRMRTEELHAANESLRELSGRLLQLQDDERSAWRANCTTALDNFSPLSA